MGTKVESLKGIRGVAHSKSPAVTSGIFFQEARWVLQFAESVNCNRVEVLGTALYL